MSFEKSTLKSPLKIIGNLWRFREEQILLRCKWVNFHGWIRWFLCYNAHSGKLGLSSNALTISFSRLAEVDSSPVYSNERCISDGDGLISFIHYPGKSVHSTTKEVSLQKKKKWPNSKFRSSNRLRSSHELTRYEWNVYLLIDTRKRYKATWDCKLSKEFALVEKDFKRHAWILWEICCFHLE